MSFRCHTQKPEDLLSCDWAEAFLPLLKPNKVSDIDINFWSVFSS